MNRNNRAITILLLITLVVTIFWITSSNNKKDCNSLAEDFLSKLYNVSHTEGEVLFGQTVAVQGEWNKLDEYFREIYADLMTEECYERLAANKILGSTHFVAYKKKSDFKVAEINFKGSQEKYEDQYHVYTLDLIEYDADSQEIINEWIVEALISYTDESGKLRINDLEIEM